MLEVLIIDYSPTTRRVMRLALVKAGFKVTATETVELGLAAIRSVAPNAVIVNIDVPGMDGRAACELIHRENPNRSFPMFVVTPLIDRESREWSALIANLHLVEEPVSVRQIAATLTESVGSETVIMDIKR